MYEVFTEKHEPEENPNASAVSAHGVPYLVLAFVASTFLGLLRGKLTAVLIGPTGISLYAQAANLLQLGGVLGSLGLGLCIVREVAIAASENDYERQRLLLRTAGALQAIVVLGVLLGGLAWAGPLARWTFQRDWLATTVLVLGGVPFVVGTIVAGSVLQGRGAVRLYSGALVSGALANTIIVPLCAGLGGIEGAILGLVLASAFSLAFFLLACRKMRPAGGVSPAGRPQPSRELSVVLLRFGAAALVNGVVEIGAQLILRHSLMRILGESQAGIFQASLTVSAQTGGLFTLLLGATLFPALSKSGSTLQIRHEVEGSLQRTLSLLMPILLGLILARDLIAPMLFSREFAALSPLLPIVALGDFFRIATWPLSYPVLARGRIKTHVAVVCGLNGLLVLSPMFGATRLGLVGAAWGQAAALFVVFVGVLFLQGLSVGLWVRRALIRRFGTDALLLLLAASPVLLGWPSPVGFVAALLWGVAFLARPADRLTLCALVQFVRARTTSTRR